MSEPNNVENQPTLQTATLVKLTKAEALRLNKDRLITGMSFPALLKENYFKTPITINCPVDEMRDFLKVLHHLSRNLNQQTRYYHSQITGPALDQFKDLYKDLHDMIEKVSNKWRL